MASEVSGEGHNSELRFESSARLQRDHPLVQTDFFSTIQEYVLYLIHRKAYEYARGLAQGKRVLDWGCNDGYGMEMLQPYSLEIAGLDSSEEAVAAARRRLPKLSSNIYLYDGRHLPFPAGAFDLVISFQVIEHVKELDRYLSGILASLKQSGLALITTPNRNLRLGAHDKPWNPFHVTEYTPEGLRKLLAPWFSEVEMRGLRGEIEIETIERSRCAVSRRASKRVFPPAWKIRTAIITSVKRAMPGPLVEQVKGFLRRHTKEECAPSVLSADVLSRFSTDMLYYSDSDLAEALDLMAICAK